MSLCRCVAATVGLAAGLPSANISVGHEREYAVRLGELLGPRTGTFVHLAARAAALEPYDAHGAVLGTTGKAVLAGGQLLQKRATVLAFDNGFVLAGLILLAGLPLALMLRPSLAPRRHRPPR